MDPDSPDSPPLLIAASSTPSEWVEAVRAIPYGRPSERTSETMLRERRGTCSTKNLYLARILDALFPDLEPVIVHRVYRVDRALARELYGESVGEAVPAAGLVDVHRYLLATIDGRRVALDATFPGRPWDGRSSMPLACGSGQDFPAGPDPDSDKRALEATYCDPVVREPFIAALSAA
jgi:hypothetical protein